jgi:hypothetical protein
VSKLSNVEIVDHTLRKEFGCLDPDTLVAEVKMLDYWLDAADEDLHCFSNKNKVREIFLQLITANELKYFELPNKAGIVVFVITDNLRGDDSLNELFMYITPAARKDVWYFKAVVEKLEECAKQYACKYIRIASNIGYKDEIVLKCLQRWGYGVDVVCKEVY